MVRKLLVIGLIMFVIYLFVYVSGSTNQISEGTGLTANVNSSLSDIIQFRIIRDNANNSGQFTSIDNVNSAVSVCSFDIHYEKDSLGSNNQYI